MLKISEGMRSALHVINAIIWILLVFISWSANATYVTIGFYLMSILTAIYFLLGVLKGDKLKIGVPFLYPVVAMLIIWIIAFAMISATRGDATTSFILGMHPGMFAAVIIFWVGSLLTGSLGFAIFYKESLADDEWDNFMKEAAKHQKLK